MALNESIFKTKNPIVSPAETVFVNSDGTNPKTLYTVPSSGTAGVVGADECVRITNIPVVSSDTSAREVLLFINYGNGDILMGFRQIPANSGNGVTAGNPSLNLLLAIPDLPRDGSNNPYIILPRGAQIKAQMRVAVTATFSIRMGVNGEEYKS